ncbi:rod shape-determining protein MreC [Hydrogenophaga sp.]|uniref:rod shape-determining protein MreC n=1 Tax=Hydrogenophaga sp. TaxID=1904254 RepID=UPI00199BA494|nr:rod shape-determining protein MreC [Hydrogenophaga sp.]MBD3893932.1 rod shape-determining protein MreC [Hydrogenophaga sp.]
MPLGTLDRSPPPFFKQGPSALSKLLLLGALAVFLMMADLRWQFAQPVRATLASALYPLQWLVLQPVRALAQAGVYFSSLQQTQQNENQALMRLAAQAANALQLEQLQWENQHLRQLLAMRERISTPAQGAQVLYDSADPFSRKVVIDRGQLHGVVLGSPVIDENGVLGQVTRVYPMVSEVSLLIDREQAIPVLNLRSGLRSVAYGRAGTQGDGLELRYTLASADVAVGDLLTTSGVDGIYPPGLPVARVTQVDYQATAAFARITADPLARMQGALHVLVLQPVGSSLPSLSPEPQIAPAAHAPSAVGGRTP